jgi:hypothetical protein
MAVMVNDTDSPHATQAPWPMLSTASKQAKAAVIAVAAGRVALGLAALAWPRVPARPWVGAAADDLAARVFGRALGGRDLALGLGALGALPAAGGPAAAWVAAGALSDALDVAATVAAWPRLPRYSRWLVVASAGGAALAGAAGAVAILQDRRPA